MNTADTSWDTLDADMSAFKEETANRYKRFPFAFKLEKNTRGKFVILQDAIYRRYEHTLGEWRNQNYPLMEVNCLDVDGETDCPMCDYRLRNPSGYVKGRTLLGYLSVMALGDFYNKDKSKKYVNPIRMLRVKSGTMEQLREIRLENDNSLEGLTITAKRSNEPTSAGVGDSLVHGKRLTVEEILALNPEPTPIDFAKELPTWSRKEINKLMRQYTGQPVSSESDEEEAVDAPGW